MRRGRTTQDPGAASGCGSAHRPVAGDRRAEYREQHGAGLETLITSALLFARSRGWSGQRGRAGGEGKPARTHRCLRALALAGMRAPRAAVRGVTAPNEQPKVPLGPTRCIRCIGTTSAAHELPIGPRSTIVAIAMRQREQRPRRAGGPLLPGETSSAAGHHAVCRVGREGELINDLVAEQGSTRRLLRASSPRRKPRRQ